MTRKTRSGRSYVVQSVERACFLLNRLKDASEPVPLRELASIAGLDKSSVYRYLWTLELHGYVERRADRGGYVLGTGFAAVRVGERDRLIKQARPYLEALRDRVNETTGLGILEGTTILYLDVVESQHPMRFVGKPGDRTYIHTASLGKAICAQLPDSEIEALLSTAGMQKLTDSTITDPDDYMKVITEVRERGYSVNDGESDPEARSISVPIPWVPLPAAISIVAPRGRMGDDQITQYVPLLIDAAQRIVG